ncbi:MAG: hypothetical protein H0V01_10620 [Bacteroidetes bacterium]|nr:hypothetical protein [Bacteroidota bacterium]
MKQLIFSYLILLIFISCQSGENEKSNSKNLGENNTNEIEIASKFCMFSTKNDLKSEGINMELPYPCEWTIISGQNQNVVKKFQKVLADGSAIEELLVISNIGRSLTEEEINILLSEKILTEGMDAAKDRSISFERLEINGKPSAKIVYETKLNNLESEIFSKVVQIVVYHNQCLIRIQLGTFSQSKEKAVSLYDEFNDLFTRLTTSTKFHDN